MTVRALGRVPSAVAVSVYSPGYRSASTYAAVRPGHRGADHLAAGVGEGHRRAGYRLAVRLVTRPSIWLAPTRVTSRRTSPAATATIEAAGWWFSAAQISRYVPPVGSTSRYCRRRR